MCRDLRAFHGVKFGLADLLRVKDLTFRNSVSGTGDAFGKFGVTNTRRTEISKRILCMVIHS